MLLLIQTSTGHQFGLREGESCIVGRDNAQIKIADKSISRKHALITVQSDCVLIQDLKSSNGSYINNVRLEPHKDTKADTNAIIKFGVVKFSLVQEKLTVTCTGITIDQKESFHKLMGNQNVTIVKQWKPEVTHVVCFKPIVTKKVLSGLIKAQHIVNAAFFHKRWSHIQEYKALPEEIDFRIGTFSGDDTTVTVTCWSSRLDLFQNKVFVFTSQQDQGTLKDVIEMCSGKVTSSDSREFTEKDFLGKTQHIVVHSGEETKMGHLRKIMDVLKHVGQRTILPTEISNAILDGSTTNACNSNIELKNVLMAGKATNTGGALLVGETQVKVERKDVQEVIAATATMDLSSIRAINTVSSQQSAFSSTENANMSNDYNYNLMALSDSESDYVGSKKRPAESEADLSATSIGSKRLKGINDFDNGNPCVSSTTAKSSLMLKKKVDNSTRKETVVRTPQQLPSSEKLAPTTSPKEVPSVFNCVEKKTSNSKLRLKRKKPDNDEDLNLPIQACVLSDIKTALFATAKNENVDLPDKSFSPTSKLSMKRKKSDMSELSHMEKSSFTDTSCTTQPRRQLQALFNSSTYKARDKMTESTANTSRRVKTFRKQKLAHYPPSGLVAKRIITNHGDKIE